MSTAFYSSVSAGLVDAEVCVRTHLNIVLQRSEEQPVVAQNTGVGMMAQVHGVELLVVVRAPIE